MEEGWLGFGVIWMSRMRKEVETDLACLLSILCWFAKLGRCAPVCFFLRTRELEGQLGVGVMSMDKEKETETDLACLSFYFWS